MKYLVRGICFVPTYASMEVDADSAEEAQRIAKERFIYGNRRDFIEPNSDDEAAAFEWEPLAEERKEGS